MINYMVLVKNKKNKKYLEKFSNILYMSRRKEIKLATYFTQEELYSLLFDEVYGKYFRKYYEDCISEFLFLFEKNALEVAYVLHDKEILAYCFSYFAPNHQMIVDFLKKHPDASHYLLTDYNLCTYFNKNLFHGKSFLENLSIAFIQENMGYIIRIISRKFPYALEKFLKEIENFSFSLQSIISSFSCGERKELLSFLNAYQKQYDVDLELYKKDILKVLFSHKDMEEKENNPYLEALEMILDELLGVQNLTINDIEYKTNGSYSDLYQIGDFFLKLGDVRHCFWIPSHKNVLRPIFRRYLCDIHLMIEIVHYVPILEDSNYKICQNLFVLFYEDGIILDDIHPNNIGKYCPNPYAYFKNMYIANESIGFLGDNYEQPEEGEFVLIDTDYLEYAEDCKIEDCISFELIQKYIKELNGVKTLKKKVG